MLSLLISPTLCFSQGSPLPMAANPEGVAVLDFKAEFQDGISSYLSYFEEKCGYALQTDFNMANLSQGTSEENRYSVSSFCAEPLNELGKICEKGEAYKALVVKKIKKFTCRYLGATGKLNLSIDNTNLIWSYENETPNQGEYANKILTGLL